MNEQENRIKRNVFLLAYQSLGIVYGDLSISPLYVYRSAFSHPLHRYQTEEVVFGAFSLVFWSLTVFPLIKYVGLLLSATDNGEGGTIALYSLICRHAKLTVLPNHQAADEELSSYRRPGYSAPASVFKRYLKKHGRTRNFLLILVLFAACMVIGDGVFTPAIAVLSSLEGLQGREKIASQRVLVTVVCGVLVCLFALQHCGTHKVSFIFAPAVIVWLLAIATLGVYNTVEWNPKVFQALSPHYIYKFFNHTGRTGWMSIGGMLLCVTGTEAMNVDLGHFSPTPIRIAFSCIVYPCLVLQYMGQAAYLSKNLHHARSSFYSSIPDSFFWVFFSLAFVAAIVASQSVISATFSIVKQCQALGCFPRVKIVHTSRSIEGQIYIPEINWILMCLSVIVTIGFQDTILIGNAYGLSFMIVTSMNTGLLWLVSTFVWHCHILLSSLIILFFSPIEILYLSSSVMKIPKGGWAPLVLGIFFTFIMYIWQYGNRCKYMVDAQNKVPMKWILALGPSLGIVRVPGIGCIYTELVSGIPAIFTHFLTNLPAIHQVVVFVCVKTIPIPHVSDKERYLVGRIGPKPYRMYRCILRYGYKDVASNEEGFEDSLVMSLAEFIRLEAENMGSPSNDESPMMEGRMAVVRTSEKYGTRLVYMNVDDPIRSMRSSALQSLRSEEARDENYENENDDHDLEQGSHKSQTRFQVPLEEELMQEVKEELEELVEAKDSGLAYIVGHSHIKARRHSSLLKRLAINAAYSFLWKNCRSPSVTLHIPHISLIEVGMNYHV